MIKECYEFISELLTSKKIKCHICEHEKKWGSGAKLKRDIQSKIGVSKEEYVPFVFIRFNDDNSIEVVGKTNSRNPDFLYRFGSNKMKRVIICHNGFCWEDSDAFLWEKIIGYNLSNKYSINRPNFCPKLKKCKTECDSCKQIL